MQWDIRPEASCLNLGHPRLQVTTSSELYDDANDLLRFLSVMFAGAGLMLVLRGLGASLWQRLCGSCTTRMLPELDMRNLLPARRVSGGGPIAPVLLLSNFTVVWIGTLGVLLILYMLLLSPPSRYGLSVRLDDGRRIAAQKSPWPETMSVYVGADNRFYVNSKPTAPEELRNALRRELGKQTVWTVYFEADPQTQFGKPIYAMDAIKAVGAKIVWITPKFREELDRQAHGVSSGR